MRKAYILHIRTWNGRSLEVKKLIKPKQEIDRLKLGVVGIGKFQWRGEKIIDPKNIVLLNTMSVNGVSGIKKNNLCRYTKTYVTDQYLCVCLCEHVLAKQELKTSCFKICYPSFCSITNTVVLLHR